VVLAAALAMPAPDQAQSLDGTAEVTVSRNANVSNGQSSDNNALGQNYTLGWTASFLDPRILRYNLELAYLRNSVAARGDQQQDQRGRQHNLGFKVGTSFLSSGAFPITIEASRLKSTSSGELGPANPIRGAAFVPIGALPPDFETETQVLNVNSRINVGALPRVELGYRTNGTIVTGGSYRSEQRDENLSASVTKDTRVVRQSLRYEQSGFENIFPQTYSQRLNNLDYDFTAMAGSHLRLTAHAGRRGTLIASPLPVLVDASPSPYTAPVVGGQSSSRYASAGISYEPTLRLALRLFGSFDQQQSGGASTDALLGTLSAHYEVFKGLSLNLSGTSGDRTQMLGDSLIRVATRSGVGGFTYRAALRWIEATIGATRGLGFNTSTDGQRGRSESWSREAGLSSSLGRVGLGASYERSSNRDEVLELGNYESERMRVSAQTQAGRFALGVSGDELRIFRSQALAMARGRQRTYSGNAAYRLWAQNMLTLTGGGFQNRYSGASGPGRDETLFWGGGIQIAPVPAVQWSLSARNESALATSTRLDQQGISVFSRLEYRLRTLAFALEYRNNQSRLQYATMAAPDTFRGRQLRFSVIRRFGVSR
jgi:hypothetical protein